jgi:adhesin transport system outer membrane protein
MRLLAAGAIGLSMATAGALPASSAEQFTILDAINQAVQTHPGVGEAAANRRATESEMRQVQSTLLPQVRVEARSGREKFDFRDTPVPPAGNNTWLNAREASVVARQLLFDGFATINEIWRQASRVDAAAYRVRERTELLALDAAEAYIDVVRYTRLVALAQENVSAHRRILSNVTARFEGGRAGQGDLEQVRERVEAATAVLGEFRQRLDEVRGTFRKAVGIEPFNLRYPGRLRDLPASKDASLAITLRHNPTIQAAQSDREAAKYGFDATAGAFFPTIALEGRTLYGVNTGTIAGARTDTSGMVVASWDIFRGGQDMWKRTEAAERYTEQTMRHARLQRDAFESVDKAWAARTLTGDRIAALTRQIASDRQVIVLYQQEFELGQRSLIDLLNAQNQLFNALVSLESARGVAVFADYQLLAAMGQMLLYLKTPHPIDSEPLDAKPFGLIPYKLPAILVTAPEPGSEPLNIGASRTVSTAAPAVTALASASTEAPGPVPNPGIFASRWPEPQQRPLSWFEALFARPNVSAPAGQAAVPPTGPLDLAPAAMSYAPVSNSPRRSHLPDWLLAQNRPN